MAVQLYLIPLGKVKEMTGAKTDEQAAVQSRTIEHMIEAYTGQTLFKKDIANERITLPYGLQKVIRPECLPVNSVEEIRYGDGQVYSGSVKCGTYGVELGRTEGIKPQISALEISYNAGLYDDFADTPAILQFAAEKLLYWFFVASEGITGFQSEHLGEYSYSKGNFVRGIPQEIASILDSVRLV